MSNLGHELKYSKLCRHDFLRDHAAAPAFLTEPRFLRQRGMRALIFALSFSMAFAPGG
jgi:hypothetical protein